MVTSPSDLEQVISSAIKVMRAFWYFLEVGVGWWPANFRDVRGLGGGARPAKMEAWRTDTDGAVGAVAGYLGERSSQGSRPALPCS